MKYIVIKEFIDKYTGEEYILDRILELSAERAKEILSVGELIKKVQKPKKK